MPKKTKAIKATDLKGNKPWLKKVGVTKYQSESIEKRKTFLIVCEGQSEELYFKSFPVVTATVKPVPLGCSKSKLVDCAKEMVEGENYDFVWCVFDMDFKAGEQSQFDDFDNAVEAAIATGFECAYSNDAFELWYVLHYEFIDQEQLRDFYYKKLSEYWGVNYVKIGKTRKFASSIYTRLEDDVKASQERALSFAEKLFKTQENKVYHNQNPVTIVYKLVEALKKHMRS